MSFTTSHVLPFDRELVWDWHTRKGAAARLIPPFFPMHPVKEAKRLSDGTTTYSLPAGLRWVSRHDLSAYRRGHRFSEVCVSSPIRSIADWRHTHSFADVEGGTLITDDIHTRAPSGPLKSFLAYRQHQLLGDLSFLSRIAALVDAPPLTVGVTGSRSLIGRAVTAQLRTAGHTVVQIVREKMRPGRRLWEPFHPAQDLLDGIDVVVHLAGEPMLGRFNEDHKKAIRDSRIVPTRKLAELAASSPQCTAFICASAIGLYGPHTGEAAVTETSEPGEGFLAEVTQEWEAACTPAVEAGKRVVNIRTWYSAGAAVCFPSSACFFLLVWAEMLAAEASGCRGFHLTISVTFMFAQSLTPHYPVQSTLLPPIRCRTATSQRRCRNNLTAQLSCLFHRWDRSCCAVKKVQPRFPLLTNASPPLYYQAKNMCFVSPRLRRRWRMNSAAMTCCPTQPSTKEPGHS